MAPSRVPLPSYKCLNLLHLINFIVNFVFAGSTKCNGNQNSELYLVEVLNVTENKDSEFSLLQVLNVPETKIQSYTKWKYYNLQNFQVTMVSKSRKLDSKQVWCLTAVNAIAVKWL